MSKISEEVKVNAEVLGITSAAATTSLNYDMSEFDRALFVVNVQGAALTTVALDLMESSGATVAGTSAAGGKAGIVIGGAATNVPLTGGVRQMTLTWTTATTATPFTMYANSTVGKTFTYTTSTALLNSSAWTTAALYYGTTIGSSVNTGLALSITALQTALSSTKAFGNIFTFSTGSTATLTIGVMDSVTGSLGFNSTFTQPAASINQAVGAFDIKAEDLNSTAGKRYVSLKCATATTTGEVAVTVIRAGGRYNPSVFPGALSS